MPVRLFVSSLLLLLAAVACGTGAPATTADPGRTAQPLGALSGGQPLPETSLPVLGGEGTVGKSDLTGTPTVINFWATWCPFCVEEMPAFEEVHQDLGAKVQFVGVDREDSVEKALTLAEEAGVTYTLVEDGDGSYFRALKGRGMPTTVFVDEDGVIQHRHAGPLTEAELRELIEEHLNVTATS